jgi:type IV pilus assembly protein PilW
MNAYRHRRRAARSQRGISLIEVMVSLALGALLMVFVVGIFVDSKTDYGYHSNAARLQENGRLAMELIKADVRMAGFAGCLKTAQIFNNLNTATDFAVDFATPIEGFEANGTGSTQTYAIIAENPAPSATAGSWTPALDANLTGTAMVLPGTDVLVIRHVQPQTFPLTAFGIATALTAGGNNFLVGEVLVATDCEKASVFNATAVNAGTGAISHGTGAGTLDNAVGSWPLPAQQYDITAEVGRLRTVAYFVGRGAAGQPALFIRETSNNGTLTNQEMIEGVESMQVLYGVDNNNDGALDAYSTAAVVNAASDWPNVVSVRVSLLIRTIDNFGLDIDTAAYDLAGSLATLGTRINPVNDRRLRKVFTSTVSLRNRLP